MSAGVPVGRHEAALDPPEGGRAEGEDLQLPVHQHGQGRGLHPACGPGVLLGAGLHPPGQGPGGVHSDQPVCLRAASGGVAQAIILGAGPQILEALADGLGGHRLQPEALAGLVNLQVVQDLAKDQLALAAGVAGVDHARDVLAVEQFLECRQAGRVALLGLEFEGGGKDRQILELPLPVAGVDFVGILELDQVAHGPGNHPGLALQVFLVVFKAAQGLGDIAGHAGFLGNDQGLGQQGPPK